tara:strand:+ start:372 stop:572 length:201 start_codon:yes stop_codon:yes gene_type:complete
MDWILTNKEVLLGIVTAVVTLASLIASLTPTPKDDTVVGKLYKLLDLLALNVGKAKETGETKKDDK